MKDREREAAVVKDQRQKAATTLRKRVLETPFPSVKSKRTPKRGKTETYASAVEDGGLKVAV